jgi:membrane-associated phospholipid phosphatase
VNLKISANFQQLKGIIYIFPLVLLAMIAFFLYQEDALTVSSYVDFQKDWFYFLNNKLSQWPQLQNNLTQLGDALIFLSFLAVFIVKAPKIWQALAAGSIISAILSKALKAIFSVPRPAAVFPHDTFTIIGKPLMSTTNSLPSGHAITNFTILTILFFAFLPQKKIHKLLFFIIFIAVGLVLIFTRVGVGAHFPLDVIIGGIFGFISGITGIFIQNKFGLFAWIGTKKYHPFFIFMLTVCLIIVVNKIIVDPLIIFYLTVISLIYSLYLIAADYFKKS